MPLGKEIIILIFVLVGCLVISFSNLSPSVNQPLNEPKPTEESSQKEISSLSEDIWKLNPQKENPVLSQVLRILRQAEKSSYSAAEHSPVNNDRRPESDDVETIASRSEENTEIQTSLWNETSPSLEDTLAEVKNLSSDLKLEFEEKDCSSCDQEKDSVLKEYVLSIGYFSWQEYSLSKQYQLAKEYYLANKDSLLAKNPPLDDSSPSICATILASPGAGTPCTCDYAMGPCYQDTPYGRYYHCLGACCCACCIICCGVF